MEAAACLVYDSRFLHLPTPNKGINLRVQLFPASKQAHPGAASHSDSTARGDGESTEKATAGIEPTDFYHWVGARTEHKVDSLLERLSILLILLLITQLC